MFKLIKNIQKRKINEQISKLCVAIRLAQSSLTVGLIDLNEYEKEVDDYIETIGKLYDELEEIGE